MKFDPVYTLKVEVQGGQVEIKSTDSFALEFDVNRQNLASSQTATFRIHNLRQALRDRVFKDQYLTTEFRSIEFYAGYKSFPQALLFSGNVKLAQNFRESQDIITEIECYSGAYAMGNGYSTLSVNARQSVASIINALAKDLPEMNGQKFVSKFPVETKRGSAYAGSTWNYIVQLSNGLAVIDNGTLYCLNEDEYISGEIPVLNADTGLLDTPRRTNAKLEFTVQFEPRLGLFQIVRLESSVNKIYNGDYKVMGLHHRGLISPTQAGDRKTTVSLWKGLQGLVPFTAG